MTTGSFFDGIFAHEKHYWFYLPIYLYSNFGGVREVAKKIGLGENEDDKLARLDETDVKGTQCFSINTDLQVDLEMPSIRNDCDMLQGKS